MPFADPPKNPIFEQNSRGLQDLVKKEFSHQQEKNIQIERKFERLENKIEDIVHEVCGLKNELTGFMENMKPLRNDLNNLNEKVTENMRTSFSMQNSVKDIKENIKEGFQEIKRDQRESQSKIDSDFNRLHSIFISKESVRQMKALSDARASLTVKNTLLAVAGFLIATLLTVTGVLLSLYVLPTP